MAQKTTKENITNSLIFIELNEGDDFITNLEDEEQWKPSNMVEAGIIIIIISLLTSPLLGHKENNGESRNNADKNYILKENNICMIFRVVSGIK
jgi:hypothetical protein